MKFGGNHVFVVNENWLARHGQKDDPLMQIVGLLYSAASTSRTQKAAHIETAIDALKAAIRTDSTIPACYSCNTEFRPKMLCHSKERGSGPRQLRCISCAVKHGLITLDEYKLLALGLKEHNRIKPEVLAIVKA